jgi:hypothetical protein
MALSSDAAMVLYYDIAGDNADHDDWHTYEHLHERLSIPGFVRASRWTAEAGAPKYMVIYEVTGTDVATSPAYLERLNNPTAWTTAMMPRFRGMVRGFCAVVASAGYGLGRSAISIRFTPAPGREAELKDWLAQDIIPALASRRGMASVQLQQPAPPPPMTKEQAIRGADTPMRWLLLATAYDAAAMERAVSEQLPPALLQQHGAADVEPGRYALHYSASKQEVERTVAHAPLHERLRQVTGTRRQG